jgi:hypothetical protein
MMDYQIQPNTRRCCVTGTELPPGSRFYSVLLVKDGKLVRQDYSSAAWAGPPPGAFSFWSGRVPAQEQGRQLRIDDELLLDCLQRLQGQTEPERVNFRFVAALLLMRRKRLRFEQARTQENQEILCLRCSRTGNLVEVVNPQLRDEEMAAVQEEVFKVLGWE